MHDYASHMHSSMSTSFPIPQSPESNWATQLADAHTARLEAETRVISLETALHHHMQQSAELEVGKEREMGEEKEEERHDIENRSKTIIHVYFTFICCSSISYYRQV